MSAPVFAATDGSITITNATVGETYKLYKIFDATYSGSGNNTKVSYSLANNSSVYDYMFNAEGNPKAGNTFFTYSDYDENNGTVIRVENTLDADIITYLTDMVRALDAAGTLSSTNKKVETEADRPVVFDNIPYGYYLIDKGTKDGSPSNAAVTIDSNTPTVKVIDKNQVPGSGFEKLVKNEDTGEWEKNTSANVGDMVDFQVKFTATNYDGKNQIKYYRIKDEKGSALWVEFNTIKVVVDGEELTKGYYHAATTDENIATGEWDLLGSGWTEDQKKNPSSVNPNEAEWYLVHYGYDEFDIVIPWMENHQFTGTAGSGIDFTYAENADSKFDSPVNVEVLYEASVEPGATIGPATNNNLWNKATLTWTSTTTTGPEPDDTTIVVYALGIEKTDAKTGQHLQGAVFELYYDEACTNPLYVIPTGIDGVYMKDDLGTVVSGEKREQAREEYAAYLEAYLGPNFATAQKNVVTTEVNGKIVVLGLEKGQYYLEETQAPAGYNRLTRPVMLEVGATGTNNAFFVVADANGKVVDAQAATGDLTKHNYIATSTVVENSTGILLPSTGGVGTMILLAFGALIAMAFAIFLITNKKMSVYED
ncbi:MAG: SpaA isopeptide-forming pilin-related protein [Parabacteroides sp.]|nr:SpaA isopeptide-forming pilin-related protein [Parabacteroides sp.]